MSENEIRSQIASKEDNITKVEEEASKKEAAAENEVAAEFDEKLNFVVRIDGAPINLGT